MLVRVTFKSELWWLVPCVLIGATAALLLRLLVGGAPGGILAALLATWSALIPLGRWLDGRDLREAFILGLRRTLEDRGTLREGKVYGGEIEAMIKAYVVAWHLAKQRRVQQLWVLYEQADATGEGDEGSSL